MTQEDKEHFEINTFCRFYEKEIIANKVRDHCHLTGKYRGPAHSECNVIVKQSQFYFNCVILHIFSNFDCHLFF